jgi:hypothetical protein
MALNRALYIAHDEPGDPGRGNRPDEDGDLVIVVPYAMREGVGEALEVESGIVLKRVARMRSREHAEV